MDFVDDGITGTTNQREDYRRMIEMAENGKIGTEKYKMLKPDIVTMDFNMDEADGMEALDLILAHNPDANIIMVSSMMGMRPYAEAAMAKGAKAVTTKPVDEKKLIAAMQSLLS
jgi:two-component system chemotaxis response regulator CheY